MSWIPSPREPADDLMAVAEAVGVVPAVDEPIPYAVPGIQPECEFTAGPTGWGPPFADANLARLLAKWEAEQ